VGGCCGASSIHVIWGYIWGKEGTGGSAAQQYNHVKQLPLPTEQKHSCDLEPKSRATPPHRPQLHGTQQPSNMHTPVVAVHASTRDMHLTLCSPLPCSSSTVAVLAISGTRLPSAASMAAAVARASSTSSAAAPFSRPLVRRRSP
jgi:hypothetical protein